MTREEAIRVIEIIDIRYMTLDAEERQALGMAIKALEQEPKTGHWIELQYPITDSVSSYRNKCSECGEIVEWTSNYCPNCGAKMEEEE